MKRTLSTYEVAGLLMSDEYAKWSRPAAYALAEYYENLENESGEEIEFDAVAIRCEWNEYATAEEIAEAYDIEVNADTEDTLDKVRDYISGRSEIIELENGNGYLVRAF